MFISVTSVCLFSSGVYMVFIYNRKAGSNNILRNISTLKGKSENKLRSFLGRFKSKKRLRTIENELYQSASMLENIIVIQKNSPKGAAYIIEQIASYSRELRKPFEYMLYFLRMNQKEEAINAFVNGAGTDSAREYADILIKMDTINPSELKENISLLRKRLREEAITREKKSNEVISDLIYIPVLANVMLIFVNFIYISYYAEQKELFQQLLF